MLHSSLTPPKLAKKKNVFFSETRPLLGHFWNELARGGAPGRVLQVTFIRYISEQLTRTFEVIVLNYITFEI